MDRQHFGRKGKLDLLANNMLSGLTLSLAKILDSL